MTFEIANIQCRTTGWFGFPYLSLHIHHNTCFVCIENREIKDEIEITNELRLKRTFRRKVRVENNDSNREEAKIEIGLKRRRATRCRVESEWGRPENMTIIA